MKNNSNEDLNILRESEERYRRLFETAQDGILLLDAETGFITDVNPFLAKLLGYSSEELKGKQLWEIGAFVDIKESKEAFKELQEKEYIRYENLPLKTKDGQSHQVEFVSNVYLVSGRKVIQCNIRDITERMQTRDALRSSRMIIEGIFDEIHERVFWKDKNLVYLGCNLSFARDAGFTSPKGIIGKTDFQLAWRNHAESYSKVDRQVIESGEPKIQIEEQQTTPEGNIITLLTSKTPLRSDTGNIMGVLGVYMDITKRKLDEEEVKKSEKKYKDIIYWAPIGIFQSTYEGNLLLVNQSLVQMLGYDSEEELLQKNLITDIYKNPDDRNTLIQHFAQAAAGIEIAFEWKKRNGTPIWILLNAHAIKNETGAIQYFEGFVHDITQHRQNQEELLKLRLGIERSSDAIFITDFNGTIQYINPAFEKIYGYSSSEAIGCTPRILKSSKNVSAFYKQLWSALLSGRSFSAEIINKSKNGHLINVEVSNNPIIDDKKTIIGFMGIHRDITMRRQSEENKRDLEAQLQRAQKLESLGTLASGIAHDFNNILGIILGHSHILPRLKDDPQKLSQSIEAITKATNRGASLVKQLLTFARKTDPIFESVNVNDIIIEIDKLLKETIHKTISITMSLQENLSLIIADASQIHQVLLNLCVNARDAMAKGGTLSISTITINSDQIDSQFERKNTRRFVRIKISDTGIGMEDAIRQKIFDPFFTTKGPGKGTGLGLAVVLGIVEHHNGFIDVDSVPGEGTTFTIYLPIPERQIEEIRRVKKDLKEIPGGTEIILFIEDEDMITELVKTALKLKGYTVLTARDGMKGVEMYIRYREQIALVISDLGLPTISGQEVFKKIREINPAAKVIFASGFFDPDMKSEMYKSGLKNFIQKPYSQEDMLQMIRDTIDEKS